MTFTYLKKENLRQLIFLVFVFVIPFSNSTSQSHQLIGKIIDERTKTGIEDAVIKQVTGAAQSSSNELGEFVLKFDGILPQTLMIQHPSFNDKTIELSNLDFIEITLSEKTLQLEEVVVVGGYNNIQKKRDFTGSVANISSRQFMVRPAVSFDQLLGGMAPGVDVIQPTNVLNNTPILRIRGINSVTSGIFPLIVVDGVPLFTGAIGGIIGNKEGTVVAPNGSLV